MHCKRRVASNIYKMIRCVLKYIMIASSIMSLSAQYAEDYDDENDDYDYDCSSGGCIDKSSEKPPVCHPPCTGGPNDVCKLCTTHCPGTCERKFMPCLESCGPKGCQCKMGYVRGPDNQCVLPDECPPPAEDNADKE